jgi:hypothetical protein
MLTKRFETFQNPHYPYKEGTPPNQLLTKEVPRYEQLNTLKYRDMGQVKVLLEKFFGNSKPKNIELITDGLGAYESAVKININHAVVSLGKNNQCESKFYC